MGACSSTLSSLRSISQRRRGSISCHALMVRRRRQPLVVVLSQCNADAAWGIAIGIIKSYGGNIRLHVATDEYDNVKKIGDKLLLKYLNTKLFVHKVDPSSDTSVGEFWVEIFKMELAIDAFVLHMDQMCVKSVEDIGDHLISTTFETNLFAPMLMIKKLLPTLKSQRKGKVICLTTVGGTIGIPLHSAYCSAKFALEGLLESLASECIQHSITISMIQTNLDKEQNPSKVILELPHGVCLCSSNHREEAIKIQDETVAWLEREGFLKELNVDKISRLIKEIIETKDPNFRYIVCKSCNVILSAKLKDLHGCLTIKEVSKFFLNVDVT